MPSKLTPQTLFIKKLHLIIKAHEGMSMQLGVLVPLDDLEKEVMKQSIKNNLNISHKEFFHLLDELVSASILLRPKNKYVQKESLIT